MKYLRLYESFFDTADSELFNYVWECIENSYPTKADLRELIKNSKEDNVVTKESWVRIVVGCLSDHDKKEVGNLFIETYLKGDKNRYFFPFLYNRFKIYDPIIAEAIKRTFEY